MNLSGSHAVARHARAGLGKPDLGPARGKRPATRWRTIAATGLVAVLGLAGCQNLVTESGLYYNTGLANSFNGLLLANIIRSAKGEPTYFSAIGDYSASTSVSNSTSINADIPFNPLGQGNLGASLGPSRSRDRNANVSSLETKDFVTSMNSVITPALLIFLLEGSASVQLNLGIALSAERVSIASNELGEVARGAVDTCNAKLGSLSKPQRGACRIFSSVMQNATCAGPINFASKAIVQLRNDPTNPCEYARFRLFAEAFSINPPTLELGEKGDPVFTLHEPGATSKQTLFGAKGTGIALRSPYRMIEYLGEIVRGGYGQGTSVPKLSSRDGNSIPIFVVNSGVAAAGSPDAVKVDGISYAVPEQRLGSAETDFSYRALAIVKNLLTINTSQNQLPKSPTIVFGGSSTTQ